MGTDGHAGLDQAADERDDAFAALDLHAVGAALFDEAEGVAQALVIVGLVGPEGEVGEEEGRAQDAPDATGVVDHLVHRHGQGGVVALHGHAQGVADEDERDGLGAEGLNNRRGGGVVARDGGEAADAFEGANLLWGPSTHGCPCLRRGRAPCRSRHPRRCGGRPGWPRCRA